MQIQNKTRAEAQKEIEWRKNITQQLDGMLGIAISPDKTKTQLAVLISEVEDRLNKTDLEITTRWEALRGEKGWHIYLIAIFEQYDVKRMWHINLEPEAKYAKLLHQGLRELVTADGKWAIAPISVIGALKIDNGKFTLGDVINYDMLVLPPLKDMQALGILLDKIENELDK